MGGNILTDAIEPVVVHDGSNGASGIRELDSLPPIQKALMLGLAGCAHCAFTKCTVQNGQGFVGSDYIVTL